MLVVGAAALITLLVAAKIVGNTVSWVERIGYGINLICDRVGVSAGAAWAAKWCRTFREAPSLSALSVSGRERPRRGAVAPGLCAARPALHRALLRLPPSRLSSCYAESGVDYVNSMIFRGLCAKEAGGGGAEGSEVEGLRPGHSVVGRSSRSPRARRSRCTIRRTPVAGRGGRSVQRSGDGRRYFILAVAIPLVCLMASGSRWCLLSPPFARQLSYVPRSTRHATRHAIVCTTSRHRHTAANLQVRAGLLSSFSAHAQQTRTLDFFSEGTPAIRTSVSSCSSLPLSVTRDACDLSLVSTDEGGLLVSRPLAELVYLVPAATCLRMTCLRRWTWVRWSCRTRRRCSLAVARMCARIGDRAGVHR